MGSLCAKIDSAADNKSTKKSTCTNLCHRGHTFSLVDSFSRRPHFQHQHSRARPTTEKLFASHALLTNFMSSSSKKRPPPAESVIDLTSDSGDEDCRKPAAFVTPKFPKVKHERSLPARVTPKFEDDGLEIVEEPFTSPPAAAMMPPSNTTATEDGDEDVQMVGGKNIVNLPHMRQHCTHTRFDPTIASAYLSIYKRETIDKNKDTCPQCYCYVCDKPAGECTSWFSATSDDRLSNHCCANDTNAFWRTQRQMVKNPNGMNPSHSRHGMENEDDEDDDEDDEEDSYDESWRNPRGWYGRYSRDYMDFEDYYASQYEDEDEDEEGYDESWRNMAHALYGTAGRFPNNHIQDAKTAVARHPMVQQRTIDCQKCASKISYHPHQRKPLYCSKCGRVADDSSLQKKAEKQKHFKIETGHSLFGRKIFEFTLETPDPREMDVYSPYWKSIDSASPQAQLVKGELKYEAFCLEIGPRPSTSDLESLISALVSPSHSTERRHRSTLTGLSGVDYQILRTLHSVTYDGISVGITASWDRTAHKGVC